MSQEDLAEEVGLTQVMVSYIENGTRRPSVETAKRIAKVLNIDWTEFFNDEGDRKTATNTERSELNHQQSTDRRTT